VARNVPFHQSRKKRHFRLDEIMPLPAPRQGQPLGFHVYPRSSEEGTLGNPETIIWSSINHLCSRSVANWLAAERHNISKKRHRTAVAANLRMYIQQASEFYHVAGSAKPNTAPLMYYYSFLNLAKGLCELNKPRLHERAECYSHGLSWRPNPKKMVDLKNEDVKIAGSARRGVWHALWETLTGVTLPLTDPMSLPIKGLLSYCPEISSEFRHLFGGFSDSVDLEEPNVMCDKDEREVWLRFSVPRWSFWSRKIFAPRLLAQIATTRSIYVEVRSADKDSRSFESQTPKSLNPREFPDYSALQGDIKGFNAFSMLKSGGSLSYSVPIQRYAPFPLPQMIVGYSILYWLGSLVRYDPHSVRWLMDSEYWVLIDGFMSQSRVWLLELFRWAFYAEETTLYAMR
jgi:hypothetical protein